MDTTEPRQLADVIRQLRKAEEKLLFVRETALLLQEPVLAYLLVLNDYMMDAFSDNLDAIVLFPEDASEQQDEEYDRFEELFREVKVVMARKITAARRSPVPPSNVADKLAAETWLKQQLDTWESLEADIPEPTDEVKESRNQNLELQKVSVAETPSEFSTNSSRIHSVNQPNSNNSQSMKGPAINPSADASDSTDVANRRPHRTSEEAKQWADPVDHQASTGSQKDIAASARREQPATNPCLDQAEGDSKAEPGPEPARIPGTNDQLRRGRVHPDSGHPVKAIEEHDPLLPSMVKAPDKRGHPCVCRFHPDYGANSRSDPSGQPGRSQQLHERQNKVWLPKVPPDKTASSKAHKNQLPDTPEDLLSYLNRGEYVRFHRSGNPTCEPYRARLCAPPCFDSEPLPL